MESLVLVKVDDCVIAIKHRDILMITHSSRYHAADFEKQSHQLCLSKILPMNRKIEDSSYYLYFEGGTRVECIAVCKISYLDDYHENNIMYLNNNQSHQGIIGFIYEKENCIPLVNLKDFSIWLLNHNQAR